MRALALTLALAALPAVPLAAPQLDPPPPPPRDEPPPQPEPPEPPPEREPTDAETQAAIDADFQPDRPTQSIALGPLPSGMALLSMDVGWLRSGLRLDVGVASFVGFFFSADTMLLYRALSGETGVHAGLRVTPFREGAFRMSIEGSAGQIFVPVRLGTERMTQLRGDLLAGFSFDPVTVYGRVGIIGLDQGDVPGRSGFIRQGEFGAGVETAWRRFVFGFEAWGWTREDHPNLGLWRLRAGITL